jgi:hypothetical protein
MPDRQNVYRAAPFPFVGEVREKFEGAVEGAAERSRISLHHFHDAVKVCVAELKHEGMSPEGVLITMKAYLRHTAKTHRLITNSNPQWAFDTLAEQLSVWCIDEYYGSMSD